MSTTQVAQVIIMENNFDIDESIKEEIQISEQLIKDYKDLNDKIDQTLVKIKQRKKTSLKK